MAARNNFTSVALPLALPILLFAVLVAWVRPWGEFPLNDDWVYAVDAQKTASLGRVSFTGEESAWGIPQILLGSAIVSIAGFSHSTLRWFGLLSTVLAATCLFVQLGRLGADPWVQGIGVASFVFFAPTLILGMSFMTDLPFLALASSAILTWERAIERDNLVALIGAALLTAVTILERQFGLAIVLGVVAAVMGGFLKPRARGIVIALCLGELAVFLAANAFWTSLNPGRQPPLFQNQNLMQQVANGYCALLYIGLGALPVLLTTGVHRDLLNRIRDRESLWTLVATVVLILVLTVELAPRNFSSALQSGDRLMPYFGNLISKYGLFKENEVLAGQRTILIGQWARVALTFLSCLGLLGLIIRACAAARSSLLRKQSVLILAGLFYFVLVVVTRNPLFDRYLLLPLIAMVSVVATAPTQGLKRRDRRISRWAGATCCLVLGFLAALLIEDYFRWSEARWAAGNWAVSQGTLATQVQGGWEWNGWSYFASTARKQGLPVRVTISHSELPERRTIRVFPSRSFLNPDGRIFLVE